MRGKELLFLLVVVCFTGGMFGAARTAEAAWDISTATYSSISGSTSPATSPRGFWISADGDRLYLANFSNKTIYQFSMSTAWDISTLSYDSLSYSVSSQGSPQDVALSADGTKMFMLSFYTRVVHQYTLGTAWDVSTASYDSETVSLGSANHYNFHVKRDGTKLFSLNDYQNRVQQYSLDAWDLSSELAGTNYSYALLSDGQELVFTMGDDGENMYIGTSTSERIHWYTLSTAWDTSTATYSSSFKAIGSEDSSMYKVFFNPTGTIMYASGAGNGKIYQYTLDGTDPTLSSFTPAGGATGVAVDSDLVLTFDEAVDAETGNVTIKAASGATHEAIDVTSGQVTGSGSTEITINPSADLSLGTSYYVQIDATSFDDAASNSYAGIADTSTWTFATPSAPGGASEASSDGGGGTFLDVVSDDGAPIGLVPVVNGEVSALHSSTQSTTTAVTQAHVISDGEDVFVASKIPDADQVQRVYMRIRGEIIDLDPAADGFTFSATVGSGLPIGSHPYTLTADYGIFTLSRKGEIIVAVEESAAPELLPTQSNLFEQVFGRNAEERESSYWTDRILAGDKETSQELFGAMQWQRLFGGAYFSRLPGSVRAPAVVTS